MGPWGSDSLGSLEALGRREDLIVRDIKFRFSTVEKWLENMTAKALHAYHLEAICGYIDAEWR